MMNRLVLFALPTTVLLIVRCALAAENLLPNSSFELGVAKGWAAWELTEGAGPYVTTTTAVHGTTALQLKLEREPSGLWRHKVRYGALMLDAGQEYVISAYGQTDAPEAYLRIRAWDDSGRRAPEGHMAKLTDRQIPLGRSWQRIETSFVAGGVVPYRFQIEIGSSGPGTAWLDAAQLEKGRKASKFHVRRPIEIALTASAPARVFVRGTPIVLNLNAYNDTKEQRSLAASIVVLDVWQRKIWQQEIHHVVVPGNSRLTVKPQLPPAYRLGSFRAELIRASDDQLLDQLVFSVVPDFSTIKRGKVVHAGLGTHPAGFAEDLLAIEKRLGYRWLRLWSRFHYTDWSFVEPARGQWRWMDEEIIRAKKMGFEILAVLGGSPFRVGNHGVPKWAARPRENKGYAYDPQEFARYIKKTVNHYKPWIKYWEIWNEPDKPWLMTDAADYGKSLILAATAVKQADPQAKIVAPCIHANRRSAAVSMDDWLNRALIETDALRWVDAFSLHYIKDCVNDQGMLDRMNMYKIWAAKDGRTRDIWNTEEHSRVIALPFWRGWDTHPRPLSDMGKWRRSWVSRVLNAVEAAQDLARLYITHRSVSPGPLFFFTAGTALYDSGRTSGIGPASPRSTALTVAGYLLEPFTAGGKNFLINWSQGFVFQRGGEAMIAIWADPEKIRVPIKIEIQLPDDATVLNMMGNPVTAPLHLDNGPTYIRLPGKTADQARKLVHQAKTSISGSSIVE